MNGTPYITWPTTTGTNGPHLFENFLADVKLLLDPQEIAAGNMQKQTALKHNCKQPLWHVQKYRYWYRIGRCPDYQGPLCSTSSSVDSEKSARKTTPSNDNCPTESQDTAWQGKANDRPERHTRYMCLVVYTIWSIPYIGVASQTVRGKKLE